jgi:hypothetical protein
VPREIGEVPANTLMADGGRSCSGHVGTEELIGGEKSGLYTAIELNWSARGALPSDAEAVHMRNLIMVCLTCVSWAMQ